MYKGFVIANAVLVVPIIGGNVVVASLNDGEVSGLAVFFLFGGVFLLLGIGMMLYFRNTRVDFGDGMISRTNMLGISRTWPLDSVATVLNVPTLVAPREVTVHTTFVLDDTTRLVVRVSDRTWLPDQINRLVEVTGVTPITLAGPVTAGTIQDTYPHVIGWREAHPYQFATVATIGFFVPFVIWFAIAVQ
jgi:hypothetical protein